MAKRKHREGQGLHKVLGVPALFSTAYGNVGSSIYYALGLVAAYALGMTPVVFLITGLLFVTTAWSYAEATAALPEAGGSSSFARHASNEMVSFAAGWALMLDYIVTIAISALFVPNYLATFWPVLKTWPANSLGGALVIVTLVIINIIGIKEGARLNIVLALADLGTQLLLMVVGLILLLQPKLLLHQVHLGSAPTWHQLIYGISIGTVAYTGIETVSNMAEESSNPGRDVPKAINYVLIAVLAVYAGISLVALSAMPVHSNILPVDPVTRTIGRLPVVVIDPKQPNGPFDLAPGALPAPIAALNAQLNPDDPNRVFIDADPKTHLTVKDLKATGRIWPVTLADGSVVSVTQVYGTLLGGPFKGDPVQGIVYYLPPELHWLRTIMAPWVGLLAATILIIATNAGLIGVSRLAYSLGQHRQIPPVIGRVHPTRLTPYVAIALFGGIACALISRGNISQLADLYAFGAMISFTVAHVSVVVLRYRQPDLVRPWRAPLNVKVAGTYIPLTAVLGGLGTFAVWCVVVRYHPWAQMIGFPWMIIGMLMYIAYRKAKGYSLFRTVRPMVLPEALSTDIDYNQILVPIVGSRVSDEMMVLACQLATEKSSSIVALYVIEVPMNLPLDARLANERDKANKVMTAAAIIAEQFKVKMTPVIVPARQAGRAICEEALARRSEVIILGTQRKRRIAERVFGRTVDYVLQHSPCEVLVNLVTKEYPSEGSAQQPELRPPARDVSGQEDEQIDAAEAVEPDQES